MRISIVILMLVTGVLTVSCDSTVIYEDNQACAGNVWKYDDIKTFQFEIKDTLSPMNIKVNLRTTIDYPYSNIYMFLYSDYPNGESFKDTLEFMMAKPDGEWLGENSGTVVEFSSLIGQGVFSKAGTYVFKLQHGMRENDLAEIIDVGMRIELMEQK